MVSDAKDRPKECPDWLQQNIDQVSVMGTTQNTAQVPKAVSENQAVKNKQNFQRSIISEYDRLILLTQCNSHWSQKTKMAVKFLLISVKRAKCPVLLVTHSIRIEPLTQSLLWILIYHLEMKFGRRNVIVPCCCIHAMLCVCYSSCYMCRSQAFKIEYLEFIGKRHFLLFFFTSADLTNSSD